MILASLWLVQSRSLLRTLYSLAPYHDAKILPTGVALVGFALEYLFPPSLLTVSFVPLGLICFAGLPLFVLSMIGLRLVGILRAFAMMLLILSLTSVSSTDQFGLLPNCHVRGFSSLSTNYQMPCGPETHTEAQIFLILLCLAAL